MNLFVYGNSYLFLWAVGRVFKKLMKFCSMTELTFSVLNSIYHCPGVKTGALQYPLANCPPLLAAGYNNMNDPEILCELMIRRAMDSVFNSRSCIFCFLFLCFVPLIDTTLLEYSSSLEWSTYGIFAYPVIFNPNNVFRYLSKQNRSQCHSRYFGDLSIFLGRLNLKLLRLHPKVVEIMLSPLSI